jgi:hypothetical protein
MSKFLVISDFIFINVKGVISEGLMTAQFPAAIAYIKGANVVYKGKFHEPIMHTTPRGSRAILLLAGPRNMGVSTYTLSFHF